MKKNCLIYSIIIFLTSSTLLFAESETDYIPIVFFQTVQNNYNKLFGTGGGFAVNHINDKNDKFLLNSSGFSIVTDYVIEDQKESEIWDGEKTFKYFIFNGEYKTQKTDILLIAKNTSEKLFSSLTGTSLAAVYGHKLLDNKKNRYFWEEVSL